MIDIVERLRARTSELAHEAADEIVVLRKRVAKLERDVARSRVRMAAPRHISDRLDGIGGYRDDDPQTSVDAAHAVNINALKWTVLVTLYNSPTPLNCSEIAEIAAVEGNDRDSYSPRMTSLRTAGLVAIDGLRRWEPTNRDQTSYVLTPRGKATVVKGRELTPS